MKGPRSRWVWLGILVSIALPLALVALLAPLPDRGHPTGASADPLPHLDLDADPGNGARPCDPIDPSAAVDVGVDHDVGICLGSYTHNQLEAFEIIVNYDGALEAAPEIADVAPALDDNPNANDGEDDATGLKLGSGWACFGGIILVPPVGDDPNLAGTQAHILCIADIVNPDKDLSAEPGLLATIHFQASAAGTDVLSFEQKSGVGITGEGSFDCGLTTPMVCTGATISIGGGGPVTPPPPGTPTTTPPGATATPTTPATGPAATPTPLPPGMEAEPLAAGCNPMTSTYADGTAAQTIAGAVGPAGNLGALWMFQASTGSWLGYSSQFPEASDLGAVNFLDVVFVCVAAPGDFVRPAA